MGTGDTSRAFEEFCSAYWKDREAGAVRSLAEYLLAFPGAEVPIAAEFVRLQGAGPSGPAGGPVGGDSERIGPYRILRLIGRGGQGTVCLAEDERLRRQVALKVLAGLGTVSEEATRRFRREADHVPPAAGRGRSGPVLPVTPMS